MPASRPTPAAPDQVTLSRKAQRVTDAGRHVDPPTPPTATPDTGKRDLDATARDDIAPSGAFEHAGDKPSRERSRTRR
jgi:hypothetical protein